MRKLDLTPEQRQERKQMQWRAADARKTARRRADPALDAAVKKINVAKSKRYSDRKPEVQRDWHRERREKLATRPRPSHCECCGEPGGSRKPHLLHWDHDHKTGSFRGWICHGCNLALGHLKEDPARIAQLLSYLLSKTMG